MSRAVLIALIAVAALWDVWAFLIATLTQHGGFLSLGDLLTWRTPVTAACVGLAFYLGRRGALA